MTKEDLRRDFISLAGTLLVSLSYWVISLGSWMLFGHMGVLPMPVWPAAGLAVALVYRYGIRTVPGLIMGAFLANAFTLGTPWPLATIIAVMNGLGPLVAVNGAKIFSKREQPFREMHDTVVFILWVVLIHAALTATGGASGRVLLGLLPVSEYFVTWMHWWLAHASGTLLVAPLLLSWFFPGLHTNRKRSEYFVVLMATLWAAFVIFDSGSHFSLGLPYLLIVPLAWVAIRFSMFLTMLNFTLYVFIVMSCVSLVPANRVQSQFPLLPLSLMTVAYGLVLLILVTMKRAGDDAFDALRTKNEEVERYFSSSLDLLCIADLSGTFLRLNPEWQKTLGYSLLELEGKQFIDFVHPDDLDSTLASMLKLSAQNEILCFENRYRCRDGTYRWLEWRSHPHGEMIYAVARDVTVRKQAENALKASEKKLMTLFESMSEMVVIHELVFDEAGKAVNYRITDCNKAYTTITGILRESAVGQLASDLYGVEPAPYLDEYITVATSGEPLQFYSYFAPMGKHFMISVASVGPNQFATITVDISDVKHAEEIINQVNEQLRIKNKELEQVIYVASHDLRSPLVNIDGYSRELGYAMEEIRNWLNDTECVASEYKVTVYRALGEMGSSLRYIRGSAARMDALLSGLLKLSRSGRTVLYPEELDMNLLVGLIVDGAEYQLQDAGAQVTVDPLPSCFGDRLAVSQVFANLIDNAIKYLDSGRLGQIRVSGSGDELRSVYTVEDNGIGIAKAHQEKIFEVFHRLEPGKYSGEGLGLTIVKQAVEKLGGVITVDSTPGNGTRFTVVLPAVKRGQKG